MIKRFAICPIRSAIPDIAYVVVLQHEFVDIVTTRLVVPLVDERRLRRVSQVHPLIEFGGARMIIAVEQLAAVPRSLLGDPVGSAEAKRDEIVRALDFLMSGF